MKTSDETDARAVRASLAMPFEQALFVGVDQVSVRVVGIGDQSFFELAMAIVRARDPDTAIVSASTLAFWRVPSWTCAMQKNLVIAIFAASLSSSTDAFADVSIGAEAGLIYTTGGSIDDRFGFGFAGRLGYDLEIGILHLIPEIKVAYDRMPLEIQTNVLRPEAGLRATIGIAFLAIVGFAHIGYGVPLGGHGSVDASGWTYEFGGGLDLTSLPLVDIGIWGAWNQVRSGDRYDWIGLGVSVTLTI